MNTGWTDGSAPRHLMGLEPTPDLSPLVSRPMRIRCPEGSVDGSPPGISDLGAGESRRNSPLQQLIASPPFAL